MNDMKNNIQNVQNEAFTNMCHASDNAFSNTEKEATNAMTKDFINMKRIQNSYGCALNNIRNVQNEMLADMYHASDNTFSNTENETINAMTRAFDDALLSTEREGVSELLEYLHTKTDFYTAPASSKYHSAYKGGLLEHSLKVMNLLLQKMQNGVWQRYSVPTESLIISALLHDLCKINMYVPTNKNVQEKNGKWRRKLTYTINDTEPYGHGEKSVMIASKFISLSNEEMYMIRWHMGFSLPKEVYPTLQNALRKYPSILAIMEADTEAAYLNEDEEGKPESFF